ncbi:polysaccharide deacetylase family protein [Candidatus Omnitrophota bacterium]
MLSLRKKVVLLLRDSIAFLVYLVKVIFPRKKADQVTLVYHSVGRVAPEQDPQRINLLPEMFERHLQQIVKYKHKVKITFDDGYANTFKNAFNLLEKYQLSATVFLITDFIDGKISAEQFAGCGFKQRPLSWDEIRRMDQAGIRFGSHTKTHPLLSALSKTEIERELLGSKNRIEQQLGHQIDSFAYPFGGYGSFNGLTKQVLKNAGYGCAYINMMGSNRFKPDDHFTLRRVRVYGEDGPGRLKMKLAGAYDWVDKLCSKMKI